MKKKKIIIPIVITLLLVITLGTTYAFFEYLRVGDEKSVLVTGDIYMHYTESAGFLFENALPISKEKGLEQTNNIFNFTIIGKNTSSKDIYYGVSIVIDETPEGKTPIDPSNVVFYLTSGEDILIDAIRYNNFDNPIYVHTIPKNTTSETRKDYTLRAWLTEDIWISDTDEGADYTISDWNNSYLSFKVKVEGTMDKMNMPLTVEHDDTSVSNNKQYFIARVSNYLNPEEAGELLDVNDQMKLEITSDSNNIEFTYKDSTGEETSEASDSLTLNYTFNKKQSEEVQVFVTPKNDTNTDVDVNIKLTKNNEAVYDQVINMNIKGNNYCLNNGFNKLGDCILVSENQSESVEDAKTYINSKTYNLGDTAPSYTYVEDISYNVENPSYPANDGYKYYFGDGIEFDTASGTYKLTGTIITDDLNNTHLNKYTCGTTNTGYLKCASVVKILELSEDAANITKGNLYTYKIASTLKSEVGLYKTVDDYGDTYFYRGDVENNNVYFGGYYWKIIRVNGDNSIRLIYSGLTSEVEGKNDSIIDGRTQYNNLINNPTYVGYMYGEDDTDFVVNESEETQYSGMISNEKYYFADNFIKDDSTKTFTLSGNIVSEPMTFTEMNLEDIENANGLSKYNYTCMSNDITNKCQVLINIKSYISETIVMATYMTYGAENLDITRINNKDSYAKQVIDNWYENNIVGKLNNDGNLLTSYIVDSTFCNDRTITAGNGYSLVPSTRYSAYNILRSDQVSSLNLRCNSEIYDKFSQTTFYGNAKLEYPAALITVSEVMLSGGKYDTKNSEYYLITNDYFWTMSPTSFESTNAIAYIGVVISTGEILDGRAGSSFGLRPVINISPDVLISEGDGTVDNPFKLKLA